MNEKHVCPYCGGVMRIVVCDDEGNIKRDPEKYLENPWSGLTYGIMHNLSDVPKGVTCPIARFDEDYSLMGTRLYDTAYDAHKALIPKFSRVKHKPLELSQIFRPVVFIETTLFGAFGKTLCYPVCFNEQDQEHSVFPVGAPDEEDAVYYRVFGQESKYAVKKSEYGKSWRCWDKEPSFESVYLNQWNNPDEESSMKEQRWFVFYHAGEEIAAVTREGHTVLELDETRHLLACDRGVHPNEIVIKEELR